MKTILFKFQVVISQSCHMTYIFPSSSFYQYLLSSDLCNFKGKRLLKLCTTKTIKLWELYPLPCIGTLLSEKVIEIVLPLIVPRMYIAASTHCLNLILDTWVRIYSYSKIQQTKMLVTCQRFGDWFLFGLVWPYSSDQKNIIKVCSKSLLLTCSSNKL